MAGDYRFPNWPVIPTKVAVFDDRELVSVYMAKCKRRRWDGPTACYCCPGECVGEPRDAAHNAFLCRDFEVRMMLAEEQRRKPDCPWSWAAALAAVLFILVMGVFR